MNRIRLFKMVLILFLYMGSCHQALSVVSKDSAKQTIASFYEKLLSEKNPMMSSESLSFSRTFSSLITENACYCQKYSSGVCGWGGMDANVYLDTQEVDPGLTLQNADLSVREVRPGIIQVRFNVFPFEEKSQRALYEKTINYSVIKEGGRWVVDDVSYKDNISIRKKMHDENRQVQQNPDADASGVKDNSCHSFDLK